MRVLLIVPPFGPLEYPVLGPSLLKAGLRERGFDCSVSYAAIDFAARIGFEDYNALVYADPPLLLADRVFARAACGDAVSPTEQYWNEVVVPWTRGVEGRLTADRWLDERLRFLKRAEDEAVRFAAEVAASDEVAGADVIGLSSTFGQHAAALAIARAIKARQRDKTVILGGANCEGEMGEQTLASFPQVDFVASGPADLGLPALLEALREGRTPAVPGILTRSGATPPGAQEPADLDDLPLPDFDDFFAAWDAHPGERARVRAVPVEGSRGCWWGEKHHCVFCGINGDQMRYRRKSADRLKREIEHLVRRHGVRAVWASDPILHMGFFDDLLPALAEAHDYDELFFEVKANLTREQVDLLADAGVLRLQPGIESLDDDVLRRMRKGVRALANVQLLKWCRERGIRVQWNLLCGFPGERPESYARMQDLARRIPHLPAPKACSQITIDRFSPMHADPEAFGIEVEPARGYAHVYPLPPEAIARLAYFHSQRGGAVDTRESLAVPAHARGLFLQTRIWQGLEEKVELEHRALPDGGVEIRDTRPGFEGALEPGATRLDRFEAAVLRAADTHATAPTIARRAADALGTEPDRAAVEAALSCFEARGWVWRDGERWLALSCDADVADHFQRGHAA